MCVFSDGHSWTEGCNGVLAQIHSSARPPDEVSAPLRMVASGTTLALPVNSKFSGE